MGVPDLQGKGRFGGRTPSQSIQLQIDAATWRIEKRSDSAFYLITLVLVFWSSCMFSLCMVAVRRVPPHFSILPESTEVASGGAVNLTCVAVGSPMPHVKWRLGAVELTPESSVPIGKNVLQLSDVRETATYTCVAASDLGNIEYDAEVRVKGTPHTGITITAENN